MLFIHSDEYDIVNLPPTDKVALMTDLLAVGIRLPLGDAVLLCDVSALGHHLGVLDDIHAGGADLLLVGPLDNLKASVGRGLHDHLAFCVGDDLALDFRNIVANLPFVHLELLVVSRILVCGQHVKYSMVTLK